MWHGTVTPADRGSVAGAGAPFSGALGLLSLGVAGDGWLGGTHSSRSSYLKGLSDRSLFQLSLSLSLKRDHPPSGRLCGESRGSPLQG